MTLLFWLFPPPYLGYRVILKLWHVRLHVTVVVNLSIKIYIKSLGEENKQNTTDTEQKLKSNKNLPWGQLPFFEV